MERAPRILSAAVVALLVLAGTALARHDARPVRVAAAGGASAETTTTTTAFVPNLFSLPTTTTTTTGAPVPTTAPRPTTTAGPAPTSVTSTTSATASPSTTVPVGPPITSRPGLDANYTWIEGTGCVGEHADVRLELFDTAGQPIGGDGAYVEPDGSWSWPISPPNGHHTVVATCINSMTKAVYLTYPPKVVEFT